MFICMVVLPSSFFRVHLFAFVYGMFVIFGSVYTFINVEPAFKGISQTFPQYIINPPLFNLYFLGDIVSFMPKRNCFAAFILYYQ